ACLNCRRLPSACAAGNAGGRGNGPLSMPWPRRGDEQGVMSASAPLTARMSGAAIFLHWLLAALLLFQLSLAWRMETLANVPQFIAFQLRKSVGIAILLLSLARLGIRLAVPRPAPVPASPALSFLASATHVLLYFVMIAGPITGWIV